MGSTMRAPKLTSVRSDDAANLTGDAGRSCSDMRDLRHDRRIKRVHGDLVGLHSGMFQLERLSPSRNSPFLPHAHKTHVTRAPRQVFAKSLLLYWVLLFLFQQLKYIN